MRLRDYQSRKHCNERSEARLLVKRYICEQSLGSSCVLKMTLYWMDSVFVARLWMTEMLKEVRIGRMEKM